TITGLDEGSNFAALYHVVSGGIVLSLRALVPAASPVLPTVSDLFPGDEDFERELVDLFGFKVEGLKEGRRYPLPDDWPANQYPLRKSWKGLTPAEGEGK
ncbi:MAG TPA: NADH-quinone oxidoreductase subunit C, partial [Elusimicrobiales bacterium]|nr:NADH-quinone oxidoreductase subunit C [Elusimicrobiales bacterium]